MPRRGGDEQPSLHRRSLLAVSAGVVVTDPRYCEAGTGGEPIGTRGGSPASGLLVLVLLGSRGESKHTERRERAAGSGRSRTPIARLCRRTGDSRDATGTMAGMTHELGTIDTPKQQPMQMR